MAEARNDLTHHGGRRSEYASCVGVVGVVPVVGLDNRVDGTR